jgi:hypothetical protein
MWRLPLLALLAVAGCGPSIGDACMSNIDCSQLGDRFCDTAPIHGYCTQEDCGPPNSPSACPSEAVCIRFFVVTDEQCHTAKESVPLTQADCMSSDDRCVCDVSDDKGNCLFTNGDPSQFNGHCAPSSTEAHWCERSCSSNGDCRNGYECRRTGTFGAEPLPTSDNPNGTPAKFCAPEPTAF